MAKNNIEYSFISVPQKPKNLIMHSSNVQQCIYLKLLQWPNVDGYNAPIIYKHKFCQNAETERHKIP